VRISRAPPKISKVRRALKAEQQTEFVRHSERWCKPTSVTLTENGRDPKASTNLQKGGDPAAPSDTATLLRLHPSYQSLLKDLPPLRVSAAISGATDSHGVTGGVYKARERIHPCLLIRDY
jgi:hypothetical protein